MPQHLFLSHDSRDSALAGALAIALQRVTLGQISVWHASDTTGSGGLKPGHVWLDEIRNQLGRSRAIVPLLTPRSVARPWLLFESGFGAANVACDVIPVCVGIDSLGSVPFPLAMYQAYQLADYESVRRFVEKLCARYEIQFDQEMARPVLANLIQELVVSPSSMSVVDESQAIGTLEEAVDEIKEHIDKRVFALATPKQVGGELSRASVFSIALNLREFVLDSEDQYLEVYPDMSVQDVLDAVFYMIPGMKSFQYLRRWLLRETTSRLNLIIREISSRIPARMVFHPGSQWDVVKLAKPYRPDDSQDIDRWYKHR